MNTFKKTNYFFLQYKIIFSKRQQKHKENKRKLVFSKYYSNLFLQSETDRNYCQALIT